MSLLLGKRKSKKVVVFLCTGDTCRGPMAQGYMKHVLAERGINHVEVRTAGVMTIAGLVPTPEAALVLKNAQIDISTHRSSPLTPELIRKADLILGMTPFHVQHALRMAEDAKGKVYLLKEFAESDLKNYQISDPMGMTLEVYKRIFREMKLAIDKMMEKDFFKTPPEPAAFGYRKAAAQKVEEAPKEAAPAEAKSEDKSPAPAAKKPAAKAPVKKSAAKAKADDAAAGAEEAATKKAAPVKKAAKEAAPKKAAEKKSPKK